MAVSVAAAASSESVVAYLVRHAPRNSTSISASEVVRLCCSLMDISAFESEDAVREIRRRVQSYRTTRRGSLGIEFERLFEALNDICGCALGADEMESVRRGICLRDGVGEDGVSTPVIADGAVLNPAAPSSVALVAPSTLTTYDQYSAPELREIVVARDADVGSLQASLDRAWRTKSVLKIKCDRLSQRLVQREADCAALQMQLCLRPGKRVVPVRSGYTLALKRRHGLVSAAALVAIVGGDKEQGGLKDLKVCLKWEHRLSIAQRLMSSARCKAIVDSNLDPIWILDSSPLCVVQAALPCVQVDGFMFKGDASTSEAIEKEKVYLSEAVLVSMSVDDLLGAADRSSLSASRTRAFTDIQVVHKGTSEELHAIVGKQLHSVGHPSWYQRALDDIAIGLLAKPSTLYRFTIFVQGWDRGPDQKGLAKRLVSQTLHSTRTAVFVSWCKFHGIHLIEEIIMKTFNAWEWEPFSDHLTEDPNRKPMGEVKYLSCIKILANSWRPVHAKLRPTCARLTCDEVLAKRLFGKMIGRCLKERWMSTYEVEELLDPTADHLPAVFLSLFSKEVAAKAVARPVWQPGSGADEPYTEKVGRWRRIAVRASQNVVRIMMTRISLVASWPIAHAYRRSYKLNKKYNGYVKKHQEDGAAYLGPNAMSDLICGGAQATRAMIEDVMVDDETELYASLRRLVASPHDMEQLHMFLVTVTLKTLAGWDRYIMEEVNTFPARLLRMLEAAHDTDCSERRQIAAELLGTADDILVTWDSDLSFKVKMCYEGCLRHAVSTGKLALPLQAMLLTFRAIYPHDTHEQEGWMSVLKSIAGRAPNMRLPLANARLGVKLGPLITVDAACDYHSAVVEYMDSPAAIVRHSACVVHTPVPVDFEPRPNADLRLLPVAGLATACGGFLLRGHWEKPNEVRLTARFVVRCTFDDTASAGANWSPFFIPISSYYNKIDCIMGANSSGPGGTTFTLVKPIGNTTLAHVMLSLRSESAPYVNIQRCRLTWVNTHRACVLMETAIVHQVMRPKTQRKRRRVDAPAVPEPAPIGGGADAADFNIEEELARYLEEEEAALMAHEDPDDGDEPDDVLGGSSSEDDDDGGYGDVVAVDPEDHPYQEADADAVRAAMNKLINRLAERCPEIDEAGRLAAEHNVLGIENGSISLIMSDNGPAASEETEKVVHFVRWTDVSSRKARPITLDILNRVVCIVACKVQEVSYPTAEVIVSRVPAVMLQKKGSARDTVPDWVMLYARTLTSRHCSGPLTSDGEMRTQRFLTKGEECDCGLCVSLASDDVDMALRLRAAGPLYVCHRCLGFLHRPCSSFMFRALALDQELDAAIAIYDAMSLPFLCGVCRFTELI